MTLRTDQLQTPDGLQSVPMQTVISGSAKAWVNFNGTGTVAVSASFNISSLTDNGVGRYVSNYTTAFSDANLCVKFSLEPNSNVNYGSAHAQVSYYLGAKTNSSSAVSTGYALGSGTTNYVDILSGCMSVDR